MRITEWMNAARHRTLVLVHRRSGRRVEIRHKRGRGWDVTENGGRPRHRDQIAVENLLDRLAMHGYRREVA